MSRSLYHVLPASDLLRYLYSRSRVLVFIDLRLLIRSPVSPAKTRVVPANQACHLICLVHAFLLIP